MNTFAPQPAPETKVTASMERWQELPRMRPYRLPPVPSPERWHQTAVRVGKEAVAALQFALHEARSIVRDSVYHKDRQD